MQRRRALIPPAAAALGAALTWYSLPFLLTCCGSKHPLDETLLGGLVFVAALPGLIGCLPLMLLEVPPTAAALIAGAMVYGGIARLLLRRLLSS